MTRPSPASPLPSHRLLVLAIGVLGLVPLLASRARADLPTPGGAPGTMTGDGARPFTGLAETPRAATFTGAAVTSIPIEVPPGRAGATPKLELRYSSSQGASAYGHGWSLPIARIVRSTKHGVPAYDASDTFTLEAGGGGIELEPVAGTKRFVPKVESAFARIGFDPVRNTWRVVDKGGTVLIFGVSETSRIGPDATRTSGTYAWLLARSVDATGNTIDYSYLAAGPGEPSRSGLPAQVAYGGNLRAGVSNLFLVRFVWAPAGYPRIAPVSYAAGYAQRHDNLLRSIETYAASALVRRYELSHDQDPVSGSTRLVGVSLDGFGADPKTDVALPSTVFTYSDSVVTGWPIGAQNVRTVFANATPAPGPMRELGAAVRFDTFDINGDGLVDWVDARPSQPVVRLGNGAGFAAPVAWSWTAGPRKLRQIDSTNSNLKINVFDIDGDGLPDLVDARAESCRSRYWCVYRNTGSGFGSTAMLWAAPQNNLREAESGGNRVLADVGDLNGDGRPDWIDATTYSTASPYWTVYWNTGTGFSQQGTLFRAQRNHISLMRDAGTRKQLVYGLFDMNGDGLPDFVNSEVMTTPVDPQDHWDVYLNRGSGFETAALQWRVEGAAVIDLPSKINETDSSDSLSNTYMELVDMTGDGRPDWVRHWTSADGFAPPACEQAPTCLATGELVPPECCFSVLVFVNTGTSFSPPVSWAAWHDYQLRHYTDSSSSSDREFDLLDFDGDGLIDLVEIGGGQWRFFRHPASPNARWSPVPSERRGAPDLLRSMMNGVGGETHIEYSHAALFRDNHIPFPYWAVVRRELRDGISNTPASVSDYLYGGGLWAGAARELRGFRDVWETDGADITTATRFHQDERLQGLAAVSKVLGPVRCAAVDVMDEQDACSPLHDVMRTDLSVWTSSGPVLMLSRTSTPFAHNTAIAGLAKHVEYAYDDVGNVVRETVSSPSAGAVVTDTTYAYSVSDGADGLPERYIVDKPVRTLTRASAGEAHPLAEKTFAYDSNPPATGLLTKTSTCIDWRDAACSRWKTSAYKHDRAGNVTSVLDARGGVTETAYDDYLLYARSVRNAAGHVTESVRDLRNARETRKRAPDGRVFETDYDGLGRPLRSWSTGFSRTSPEVASSYAAGVPGVRAGYVRTRQVGSAPVVTFYDGLGRLLASKTTTETSSGEQTIVKGRALYDGAGRLFAEGVPFPSAERRVDVFAPSDGNAPAWTRRVYDDYGRLREVALPDGSRTLHDESLPGVRVTTYQNLAGGEHPGKAEIELRDGLDRVWRKDVCSASPPATDPTGCPAGSLLERTDVDFDGLDRPIRITSAAHTSTPSITEIDYDGLGNRVRFESSDQGRWSYEYGNDGLLVRAVDPRGAVMLSQYDKIGRLRSQSAQGFKARYAYQRQDAGLGLVRRIRSQSGRAKVSKEFVYDARGRVAEERFELRTGGSPLRTSTTYEYDDADRRVAITYPSTRDGDSRRVVTTYSRYGQPTALTAYDGDSAVEIVRKADYDQLGNLTSMQFANGLRDMFVHEVALGTARLQCIRTTRDTLSSPGCTAAGGDVRDIRVDARDDAGNILALTDALHTSGSALSDSRVFAYDSLGRLVHATREAAVAETFSYDEHGNMSALDGESYAYAAAAPHRPTYGTDDVIEHDEAGNRTRKGPWAYTYDGLGRLTEVRHSGSLTEIAFYDEGRSRVARLDARSGMLRYYVGGLFELEDGALVRHYWLGGHVVASDVIPPPDELARAVAGRTQSSSTPLTTRLISRPSIGDDRGLSPMDIALLVALALFLGTTMLGPARAAVALVTTVAFVVAATPLPAVASPAVRWSHALARNHETTSVPAMFFYHPDHVGSPYIISDLGGTVIEQRRYDAYGRLRATFDERGTPAAESRTDVGYTGQTSDAASGLVYFGARYYDPELGLFLSPDPQAQFASPYLYGGGNPVNGNDPDGEIFGFLFALLAPILVSAAASALASGISAALQGGDFLDSFATGFVSALSGAALGTVMGGLNVAYQLAAGGSSFVEASEAMRAVVEVAARSSFTSAVTNAAVSIGEAAGLPSDWVATLAVAAPLLASLAYDQYLVRDSGRGGGARASQRTLARDGYQRVNTSVGHMNVTQEAAQGTGWERYSGELMANNLAEDAPAASGDPLRDFAGSTRAVLTNEDHFGRLPSSIRSIEAGIDSALAHLPSTAPANDPTQPFRAAVGSATHYVQDHLTLGHMVPGTSTFGGPVGAPIRFVIHQVFGGEIAFRAAQVRATRGLLQQYPALT